MPISRRALLPLLLAVASPAQAAWLRADRQTALAFQPDAAGRATLRSIGMDGRSDGAIVLPGLRAGLIRLLPLAGRDVAVLGFGVDLEGGSLDMLAVAGWDGQSLRLLAIEVADWRGAGGGSLHTRLSAVTDGRRLRLERNGTIPRGLGSRHESWTDYLVWRDGAQLQDAPVRAPLPGTQQARLAAQRLAAIRWLAETRTDATLWTPGDRGTNLLCDGNCE